MRHRLIAGIAACTWTLLAVGTVAAAPLAAQSSTVSAVTVKVTPMALSGDRWKFAVVLETHSGDLSDDLAKSATLSAGGGRPSPALAWRGDPPGGHHRKGVLEFKPLATAPRSVELTIRRAGELAPRVFRWSLSEAR